MVTRWFNSPSDDLAILDEVERRYIRNDQLRQQLQSDPALVQRLVQFSEMYGGQASPGAILGMAKVGVDPNSRVASEIAARSGVARLNKNGPQYGETTNGNHLSRFLKGAVRIGMTALSAPFEEVSGFVSAVGTAALDDDPRFNPFELYGEKAAGSSARIAISQLIDEGQADLGEGFFSGGSVREQRESEQRRLMLDGAHVTPGRLLPAIVNKGAGRTIVEPGSKPYNFVSGLVDFASNIALDPAVWLSSGTSSLRHTSKVFGSMEDLNRSAKAMAKLGLVSGHRKSIIGESVTDFLAREQGQTVVEALRGTTSANRVFKGFGGKIDPELAVRLAKENTDDGIREILADALGTVIRDKPKAGQFGTGLSERTFESARKVPFVKRNLHGVRFAQELPKQVLDLNDMKAASHNFDAYLRNAKLPSKEVDGLVDEFMELGRLDVEGVHAVVGRANERIMTEVIGRLGNRKLLKPQDLEGRARELVSVAADNHNLYAREARQYLLDRAGQPILPPWAKNKITVDGTEVDLGGSVASLLVHARGDAVFLPDVRALRREISWLSPLWDTPVIGGMSSGAVKILSAFTDKIWKPSVLLRLALPARVLPEEQARIAAHGDAALFTHPIQYIAIMMGRKKGLTAEGMRIQDLPDFSTAMSRNNWHVTDTGVSVPKAVYSGDFMKGYKGTKGDTAWWAGYLGRYATDPVSRKVATARTRGDLPELKRWFWNSPERQEMIRVYPQAKEKLSTAAGADDFIENTVWRGLVDATGGDFAKGKPGNGQLMQSIAEGHIFDMSVTGEHAVAFSDPAVLKRLEKARELMPPVLPRPRAMIKGDPRSRGVSEMWDRTTDRMFGALLTGPTDVANRGPEFAQALWKEYDRIIQYATPQVQQKIIAGARKAGLSKKEIAKLERKAAEQSYGKITKLHDATNIASAHALNTTRELLYDLSKRSQFSDVMRVVAPFAEPWKEVMTTWARLAWNEPRIARRGQQLVEGARGSGFFYEDPATGDDKFVYPGGSLVTKLLGVPGKTELTGFAGGLNLVLSSFIPGFGPAVQIPASRLIPERPEWDHFREFVFPFGEPEARTPGGVVDTLLPAWAKRAVSAVNADPENDRLFGNTVIETMRALAATGDYDDADGLIDRDSQVRLEADAMKYAKRLYWVRAIAQTTLPTGPQPEFSVDTPEGLVKVYALSEEFRKLQEEDYDSALERFVERFGFGASLVTQPKSQEVRARSLSKTGAGWEASNADLVKRYPNVVGFFAPDDGEFDITAYARQLKSGDRQALKPDDVLLLHNNTLGRLAMENAERALGEAAGTAQGKATLSRIRAYLKAEYPGFQSVVGIQRRADNETMISELAKAAVDPKLSGTPTATAIREWMRIRETATAEAQMLGRGVKGFQKAAAAEPIRRWLRSEAQLLIKRYPDFAGVYDRVFARELDIDEPDLASILAGVRG